MPKASEVAAELRKFADRLDIEPNTEIVQANIHFSHSFASNPKQSFMALARLMPRPIVKKDGYNKDILEISHSSEAVNIAAWVEKVHTCIMVKPAQDAVYECEPLLSDAELATVEA